MLNRSLTAFLLVSVVSLLFLACQTAAPSPSPVATASEPQATATPYPTFTPLPTNTSSPTNTPLPTPRPTATPKPTPARDNTLRASVSPTTLIHEATPTPTLQPAPETTATSGSVTKGFCGQLCDRSFWLEGPSEYAVAHAIQKGVDVNASGLLGLTPLHWAVGNASYETVLLLLEHEAEVDARDEHLKTPLFLLGFNRKPDQEVAKLLLSRGADIHARDNKNWTPLHSVVRNAPAAVISVFLEHGADPSAASFKGLTPLHQAAGRNISHGPDVMALMLDAGVDVEISTPLGTTPLHQAAAYNPSASSVAFLIGRGASVNRRNNDGWTALHYASTSLNSTTEVLRFLLEHGADINAQDNEGITPIHLAAAYNHANVVRFLIESGARVNDLDAEGWTALHFAALYDRDPEFVQLLLDLGADVYAVSYSDETVCQIATGNSLYRQLHRLLCPK